MAPLAEEQRDEVKDLAELECRRYFDKYLNDVFPAQLKAAIAAHDADVQAHGGVQIKTGKLIALFVGIAGASGAGATALPQLISLVFG